MESQTGIKILLLIDQKEKTAHLDKKKEQYQ